MKRDVIILTVPYSDAESSKPRPAIILAERGEDMIIIPISSNESGILITNYDLEPGFTQGLDKKYSYVKLAPYTLKKSFVVKTIGKVKQTKYSDITKALYQFIK
jgi:PemK-like, MazF-like toxin of type II toxin-antitoxin system